MKPSLCLLKAQFGGDEACGMEHAQGHAEDGVAECLLFAPKGAATLGRREEADPGSCQKELFMNLFPLGDANRLAAFLMDEIGRDSGKPIAFSGCLRH